MSTKIYKKSLDTTHLLVVEVEQKYHQALAELGTTYDLLDVYSDSDGPALTLHGHPCLAIIRITSYKDRAKGMNDIEIQFDAAKYGRLSLDQKKALIDHELEHIKPKITKKDGTQVYDQLGRPCFIMKHHDVEFGWFATVAARWGKDSVEYNQANQMIGDELVYNTIFLGQGPGDKDLQDRVKHRFAVDSEEISGY